MARTSTLPSGEEIPDSWDDYGWDIDRWENDGGRSREMSGTGNSYDSL